MELVTLIRDKIKQSEVAMIPFAEFMELALYHPELGYYPAKRAKVGKAGDFYTSATVHPVFAETLADAAIELLRASGFELPTLVEIGGGTGYLMKHLLTRIYAAAPDLWQRLRFISVESSPYHRCLQQEALRGLKLEKQWFASVEEAANALSIDGVVLSNEWLDAYPVHLIERVGGHIQEVGVGWNEAEMSFCEGFLPEVTEQVAAYLAAEQPKLAEGMRAEVNCGMKQAIAHVSGMLRQGYVLTIDYGDEEAALYHPSRKRGTLMCYYRHQAHDNPYIHVGEQDITAHVNFSLLMRWGSAVGLEPLILLRQDEFLIRCGILTRLQQHTDRDPFTSEAMRRNRAIQQLILPGGMGGVFRVLVQSKGGAREQSFRFMQKYTPLR